MYLSSLGVLQCSQEIMRLVLSFLEPRDGLFAGLASSDLHAAELEVWVQWTSRRLPQDIKEYVQAPMSSRNRPGADWKATFGGLASGKVLRWSTPSTAQPPMKSARFGHSTCVIGGFVVVFGGRDEHQVSSPGPSLSPSASALAPRSYSLSEAQAARLPPRKRA